MAKINFVAVMRGLKASFASTDGSDASIETERIFRGTHRATATLGLDLRSDSADGVASPSVPIKGGNAARRPAGSGSGAAVGAY